MNEQIQGKILEYIDQIANGLGVATEYVLTTLVKQQMISGLTTIIIISLFYLLTISLWIVGVRWYKKAGVSFNDDDFHPSFGIIIVAFILSIFVLLATAFNLPNAIKHLVNPEYYALKEIMNLFTGK